MKNLLVLAALLTGPITHSQIADLAWAKHLKGTTTTNGNDAATTVVQDDQGNVYVTGSFFGTFDLNPGVLTNSVTSAGDRDIFVVKLDALGNYIWGKRIGGSGTDAAYDMAIDGSGNLLITGHFIGTVDFDPNGGTANMVGNAVNSNGYIWKLSGDGIYQWAKYWGSSAVGNSVDVTATGEVYVAGAFEGVANGVGNQLALGITSLGDKDACFFKLSSSGTLQWAGRIGGAPESDYAYSIAATDDGVLIAGDFFPGGFGSVVDFNPGPGTVNRQGNGITDAYVLKLDVDGTYMWVNIHGGLDYDGARSIDVDSDGNYWLTGRFRLTMDMDPGAGVSNLVSAGNDDTYLAKYSPTGAHLWSGRMGGTDIDNGLELVVGSNDAVYMAGSFRGQADLNPTAGTTNVSSFGSADMHITKLFANGTFDWVRRFGGSSAETIAGLAVDGYGGVFAAGYFTGSADMDPNAGEVFLDTQNLGQTDGFVLKLRQCVPSSSSSTVSACESYTIGGETFVDSGVYPVLLTSSTGCDSTVTVTLTITNATSSSTTVQNCGAYTWNGQTYSASGTYTAMLTNAAGCDSTATLLLTVGQPSSSTTEVNECGPYTWNGETYTTDGTYEALLINAAGCDSTATLELSITTLIDEVDVEGVTITALQADADYQWVDCNNGNSAIVGETDQSFTAMQNGSYAVEVTSGNCTITSACVSILSTGIADAGTMDLFLRPNPARESLLIGSNGTLRNIEVYDAQGRLMMARQVNATRAIVDVSGLAPGTYFVRSINEDRIRMLRFSVE